MVDKQNLHTHTTYCDGADTPEEMIQHAIARGFSSIGFSGHSYMHYAPTHSMSLAGTQAYKQEIAALRIKYQSQIEVYCGLEVDMYSEIDLSGYDYLIGSVHFLLINGKYVAFDRTAKDVAAVVDKYFNGCGMEYAKAYYKTLAQLPKYGDFQIIGHFDLVTKQSEIFEFFDENSEEYQYAALEAANALAGKIPFFEVNTGAIARGYRTTPYPSEFLMREMKKLGFGAVITSDCHDKNKLDCEFDQAEKLLKKCGFTERYVLGKNGFRPVSIL